MKTKAQACRFHASLPEPAAAGRNAVRGLLPHPTPLTNPDAHRVYMRAYHRVYYHVRRQRTKMRETFISPTQVLMERIRCAADAGHGLRLSRVEVKLLRAIEGDLLRALKDPYTAASGRD